MNEGQKRLKHKYPNGESSVTMRAAVASTIERSRRGCRFKVVSPNGRCSHRAPACPDCVAHDAQPVSAPCAPTSWEALILYDPTSWIREGVYRTEKEADDGCPGWRRKGYVLEPCEIVLTRSK